MPSTAHPAPGMVARLAELPADAHLLFTPAGRTTGCVPPAMIPRLPACWGETLWRSQGAGLYSFHGPGEIDDLLAPLVTTAGETVYVPLDDPGLPWIAALKRIRETGS